MNQKLVSILIIILRITAFGGAFKIANSIGDLGLSFPWILTVISLGVYLGHVFKNSHQTTGTVLKWSLGGLFLLYTSLYIACLLLGGYFPLFGWSLAIEIEALASIFALTFLSTFLVFRIHHVFTLELIFASLGLVFLLSPHRNYRLDSPALVNSIAWEFGLSPQLLLIVCGLTASLFIFLYGSFFAKESSSESDTRGGKQILIFNLVWLLAITGLISLIGFRVYGGYNIEKGRTSNGVGSGGNSGDSPLGFHSALGNNNQPAALVRLNNDYSQNPFTPILYLREDALSRLKGNELVIDAGFDSDARTGAPGEPYIGVEDPDLVDRVKIEQSIYLLADQKNAFAIDYPLQMNGIKNPDSTRFRGAYKAISLAPTYSLKDIINDKVGDPRWSTQTKAYYLETHPDFRYRDLALQITDGYETPIARAAVIVNYLSEKSIYTLAPNHDVKPDEDPVAPYLFGDMRGYCVHFAHATVFMLRSLSIPARIATGYMTDMSQAKDGHILLRMSDRHAWAEVYVTGKGWVPFDTQPEQVESHADTQVDMELLEDLMSKLDPGEDILPNNTEGEFGFKPISNIEPPSIKSILTLLCIGLFFYISFKIHLWYSYLVPSSVNRTAIRGFRSINSRLIDLGHARDIGEPRISYCDRISAYSDSFFPNLILEIHLKEKISKEYSRKEILKEIKNILSRIESPSLLARFISFFNPASLRLLK